jgi:quercetin dioxygenase-like cupin family protein
MFKKRSASGYVQALDKVTRKTLVHGSQTLMTEFKLEQGAALPRHRHLHEQTGYLVSGRMDLTIGGETFPVAPGDSWCIPGDMEHSAIAREDSVAIEVFCPVREDYLPQE